MITLYPFSLGLRPRVHSWSATSVNSRLG